MLITKKELTKEYVPMLMVSAQGTWKLVIDILRDRNEWQLCLLETRDNEFVTRKVKVTEEPFYVSSEIWELDYGTTLMTLQHETLTNHPALKLWQAWLDSKENSL